MHRESVELVAAAAPRPSRPDPLWRLTRWLLRTLVARPAARLARAAGRALWRHRDANAAWWGCCVLYAAGWLLYGLGVSWWVTALGCLLAVAAVHQTAVRRPALPYPAETVTGAAVAAAAWLCAACAWSPAASPVAASWPVLLAAVTGTWWTSPAARRWRSLRMRVRSWTAALPAVLAELGAAGTVVAGRVVMAEGGRVEIPLRLPVRVTRESLDTPKTRREIESGMHWRAGSIREVVQDPRHVSSDRVLLVWQDGTIKARAVKFSPPQIPASVYDPLWHGVDDDGRDVLITTCVQGVGISRGLYGGESGSAKTNLLRLVAWLRAYCPDVLIWVIDLKNAGSTFASLLPRIDRIAVTWQEAADMFADAAAMIPLRGRLLRPEHNQVLPLSAEVPAVLIIGDEIATLLGRKAGNAAPIEAAKEVTSKGRALGIGAELASQYMSQTSLHSDLLPNFNRSYAGRTRTKADSQHLLRRWNRLDTTMLPTGAFYVQQSGGDTSLLFTPEVTDVMLGQAAAETAHLAPALEEPTAAGLPHYADRWAGLPDHLLPFCSPGQRAMVEAAKARVEAGRGVTRLRTAAAAPPGRLVVSERIHDDDHGDGVAELDPALAAMCGVFARAGGEAVRTRDLMAAAAAEGRSRSWAGERVTAWSREGLIGPGGRRGWWRPLCPLGDLRGRVAGVEDGLGGRRRGGDGQ